MKLKQNSFKTVSKQFWNCFCFSFISLCGRFKILHTVWQNFGGEYDRSPYYYVATDRLQVCNGYWMLLLVWSPLSSTRKYDRGLSLQVHWLDVPERVQYKLGVAMYSCLHGRAPSYLADLCVPLSGVSARQHLRSATRRLLVVPRCRLRTLSPRAFSMAGPSLWNSLPDSLRDTDLGRDDFRRLLKTHLFTLYCSI